MFAPLSGCSRESCHHELAGLFRNRSCALGTCGLVAETWNQPNFGSVIDGLVDRWFSGVAPLVFSNLQVGFFAVRNTGGGPGRRADEWAGPWCLFASLEQGAKASIAVPLTALYPINTLDPEAVIVGGGLGSVEGLYWQSFVKATRTHIWVESHRDLPIPHAALGTQAGLIGAAANLWKKVAPGASG